MLELTRGGNMKKLFSFLILMALSIGLVACGSSNQIQPSDLAKKIENKESMIVEVSASTCSYCKQYEPIVAEFTKKNPDVTVLNIVLDKIKDPDEKSNFVLKYAITGTPTTLFFKDGELQSTVTRVLSLNELEEMYNEYVK